MRILVDIGNSRCKAAIEDRHGLHPLKTLAWKDVCLFDALDELWLKPLLKRSKTLLTNPFPHSVVVSNVAGDKLLPELSDWCASRLDIEPVLIESTARFHGVTNGYSIPASFGVDRWAAIAGARCEYAGALCVVDSGTATTVDVITADGQHIGGAILPGIHTMRQSLGKYTSALFAAQGDISPFSDNTGGGIAGGTGYALVGAVDRLVYEAKARVSPITTLVTGGESSVLESLMQHTVIRDPMLVLKGVSAIGGDISYRRTRQAANCANLPLS